MIIAICGKKGHGKDTAGDYLCEHKNFIKFNFADPLKNVCKILFDFTDDQLYGHLKETKDNFWNIAPREMMQFIGTDLMRDALGNKFPVIGDSIWIKLMEKKIQENSDKNIVVCDLRFQN